MLVNLSLSLSVSLSLYIHIYVLTGSRKPVHDDSHVRSRL